MSVTVRFAPSPTGPLHIGTVRTALFNWLFARHLGGKVLMRIEDTDKNRSSFEFEADICNGLSNLGLNWDNPNIFRQSERGDLYRSRLEKMLQEGQAYWLNYSNLEAPLESKREKVIALKQTIRSGFVAFNDVIRGEISVERKNLPENIILAKDLDTPLYNFAVVVDDLDMAISHVIRGEDHISNTAKQLLIYEALTERSPQFAHLPLILAPDRTKISKRSGLLTSISDYLLDYLPEALINFTANLGYTFREELLPLNEMIKQFELKKVHKAGAIFDVKKLNWINSRYIKNLSSDKFKQLLNLPNLADGAVPIITERLEKLTDIKQFSYFWQAPLYDSKLLLWKESNQQMALAALRQCDNLVQSNSLTAINLDRIATEQFNDQRGEIYWPLRVALSGLIRSAGPIEIAMILGPVETQARIRNAIAKLENA